MVLMNPELSIFASENDANTPIILHGDSSDTDDANNPSTRTRNRNRNGLYIKLVQELRPFR